MKLILDTHTLLWWLMDQPKLSPSTLSELQNRSNVVLVSSSVIWEIAIKQAIGKLHAPNDLLDVVRRSGFDFLQISEVHAAAILRLPMIHKDPFDRMLIAQALIENGTIVTRDVFIPQ
jgi:PIN domain nuclease of toxin-antitoxin system